MPKIEPFTESPAEKITTLFDQPNENSLEKITLFHHQKPSQSLRALSLLIAYFTLTMSLTLHTKWIMTGGRMRMPWLLSAYHLGISGIGAFLLTTSSKFKRLSLKDIALVNGFAVICALNIGLSNVSLQMISLSLHQIIRSGTPLITLWMERLPFLEKQKKKKPISWMMIVVLSGMIGGIVMSVIGEQKQGNSNNAQQQIKTIPIVVTGLGAMVSAFKGVSTAALLQKQQCFTPLQLLMLTAPVASLGCAVIGGVFTAEPRMLRELTWMDASQLLANGFLAFLLNWTGFAVNKETSALTITVAGNIKQALTVMIGILAFGVEMAWIGWLGIALTLFSGLAYGILTFWFGNGIKITSRDYVPPAGQFKLWFGAGEAEDSSIASEFTRHIHSQSASFTTPPAEPKTAVALLILFDQLPRNAFRNTPQAFAFDDQALLLAKHLVQTGAHLQLNPIVRGFVYLPFEHSERLDDQLQSLKLYEQMEAEVKSSAELKLRYGQFCGQFMEYARKHEVLIRRFGRFPHRNAVMGRESTEAELEYLEGGGETFGVNASKK